MGATRGSTLFYPGRINLYDKGFIFIGIGVCAYMCVYIYHSWGCKTVPQGSRNTLGHFARLMLSMVSSFIFKIDREHGAQYLGRPY